MFRKFGIVLMILTAALLSFGCSERESNIVRPDYNIRDGHTGVFTHPGGHIVSDYLAFTMFSSVRMVPSVNFKVYVPPNYVATGRNYPVLYLLAPFRGNDSYYFNHGLVAIADKMIEEGTIKPMLIVCVDGSAGYGGTFYGNSWYGGKYAEAIGDKIGDPVSGSLVDYIDAVYNTYDSTRETRAIAGFEMGGYGAVRIAAMFPENFSSVSAISAPLDFDGAGGTGGFV
ncbi:MAG: alpha/beta hydrolase-fold protein, partial [Candidatus Zixiibacteriota bacterium]